MKKIWSGLGILTILCFQVSMTAFANHSDATAASTSAFNRSERKSGYEKTKKESENIVKNQISIQTSDELADFLNGDLAMDTDQIILESDIDMSSYSSLKGRAIFSGTIEGNGHVISNLNIESDNGPAGFINMSDGLTVKNLSFVHLTVINTYGKEQELENNGTGGVVGYIAYSDQKTLLQNIAIENNNQISRVQGRGYVGGMIGGVDSPNVSIEDCVNYAQVHSSENPNYEDLMMGTGGFIGQSAVDELSLKELSNYGTITSSKEIVGGVIGGIESTFNSSNRRTINVENVHNRGVISAHQRPILGGLFGEVGSYNNVSIISSENSGSIDLETGKVEYPFSVGGFIGFGRTETKITILDSKNTGEVNGGRNHGDTGGFIGTLLNAAIYIEASVNEGNITGSDWTGGFIGEIYGKYEDTEKGKEVRILNSRNTGEVTNTGVYSDASGGFVGGLQYLKDVEFTNLTNSGRVTGRDNVAGILGAAAHSRIVFKDCFNTGELNSSGDNVGNTLGLDNDSTIIIHN